MLTDYPLIDYYYNLHDLKDYLGIEEDIDCIDESYYRDELEDLELELEEQRMRGEI